MNEQFPAGTRIPPFREEVRWGSTFSHTYLSIAQLTVGFQLMSVNEVPTRAWDLLLVVEPITNLAGIAGTRFVGEFKITVGVGSSTAFFRRVLTVDRNAPLQNDGLGAIELLVMPGSSFIVEGRLSLITNPGDQTFPMQAKVGAFAAPRGMPFLASLESAEFQEGE